MKKLVLFSLCFIVLFLTGCRKKTPEGTWKFEKMEMVYENETVTYRIGDSIGMESVSFVLEDESGEIEVLYAYGSHAEKLKINDHVTVSGSIVKNGDKIVFKPSEYLAVTVSEYRESTRPNDSEDIKNIRKTIDLYNHGDDGVKMEYYTLDGYVKEITREYSSPIYSEEYMQLQLYEDGSGILISISMDYEGFYEGKREEYVVSWLQYQDEIRITVQGETSRCSIEDGVLILYQPSYISDGMGNNYKVDTYITYKLID